MVPSKTEKINLSHLDGTGQVRMVDVSAKAVTHREACASAMVRMTGEVLDALMQGSLPKGDALATARVAGILAAKRASEWIPLCHPLVLTWVRIEFERGSPQQLLIRCSAKTVAQTGVEMEAMTGAAAAALTVYDMVKGADRSVVIGPIQLEYKAGGKSGTYQRGG